MMQSGTTMIPSQMAPPQYSQQQQWPMMNQQQPQPQQPPQGAYYYQQAPQQAAVTPQYAAAPNTTPPTSADEVRSLWIGDLQYWMDENYIVSCFAHTGEVVSAKVIRNKQTGASEGYGFIEFISHAGADKVLQTYNGSLMPNAEQNFRLNWASFGLGEKRPDNTTEYTIFVGDLAADVTDFILQETFRPNYSSVKGAKVVIDRITGRTKGYGFVKFVDESEQIRAMTEMNGQFCSTRPMRIGPAANKKPMGNQQYPKVSYQNSQGTQNGDDPTNTTIFVGNLDSSVMDEHLRQVFGRYGQLLNVKIPVGKRCGFVQFADRSCAEEALRMLNGTQLGGQNVRLSWGHNFSNKQPQVDPSQWNGGYYGYTQGYEQYGYPPAVQDPNMYYGSYPAYGSYPPNQQQQQVQQPQ